MADYNVIKSKRKTIGLTIERDCSVTVRCPYGTPSHVIKKTVGDNMQWINDHIEKRRQYNSRHLAPSPNQVNELKAKAKSVLPQRVAYYAPIIGLYPAKVTITSAQTRFGSCSGKNAICFSYMLMLYPMEAVDYVVVHELAHIKYHNHSKQFYSLIESVLPDYKEREKLLKN